MKNELELFQEKDFPEKTMTIKELSGVLKCSRDLIEKNIRSEFPSLMEKGKTTRLNELHVTKIKLLIQTDNNFRQVSEVKTNLEKALIIQQAAQFQQEIIDSLKVENKQLLIENKEMTPKAEFYDRVTESDKTFDMSSVCKILDIKGFGRTKLMAYLRKNKILRKNNEPYQDYLGYFKSVETETAIGIKLKPVAYQKGIDYLIKRLKKDNILT